MTRSEGYETGNRDPRLISNCVGRLAFRIYNVNETATELCAIQDARTRRVTNGAFRS